MRALVTVLRIEGDKAVCRTGSGREHAFSIRTLERGARSARLVTHADGTPAVDPEAVPSTPKRTYAEKAIDMHRSGMPLIEIARTCHVGVPQVVAWLRASDSKLANVPSRRQPSKPRGAPGDRSKEASALCESGKSYREIAKLMGVHRNTVANWVTASKQEAGIR